MAITGTGTQADPWVISTPQDLVDFSASTSYWASGTYAQLGADINMDGVSGFIPIGNIATKYQGNFDGQGHVISNLTVNLQSTGYVGLFGFVSGTTISRIGCVGFDIKGSSRVSGLVGNANSASTIDGCVVENCSIEGSRFVGGLFGNAYSASISNCYTNDCEVSGSDYAGGLVGRADSVSYIVDSFVNCCDLFADGSYVGGLAGYTGSVSISNCAIYGGTHGNVLVASASGGTITNCYTSNDVSSATFHTKGFWDGTGVSGTTYLSWDFTTPVWYWDSTKQLPVLQEPSSPVPNLKTKINGTWKNASGMFTKVGGAWKQADKAFVKVGGAWKQT